MALLDDFRAGYPEFDEVADALVTKWLTVAGVQTPSEIWGDHQETGQFLLAAHLLASSPFGQAAKMVTKLGSTAYWPTYESLRAAVVCGLDRVI